MTGLSMLLKHSFVRKSCKYGVVIAIICLPQIAKAEPVDADTTATIRNFQIVAKGGDNLSLSFKSNHVSNVTNMIATASRYLGSRNPTNVRGNWCGAFMALVAHKTGQHVPHNPNLARSWLKAGPRIARPVTGAYAVQNNHVSVIVNDNLAISGNYSRKVSIHKIPRNSVFVLPKEI